ARHFREFLLPKETKKAPLLADKTVYAAIEIVDEADNAGLLLQRRQAAVDHLEVFWPKAPLVGANAIRPPFRFGGERRSAKQVVEVPCTPISTQPLDDI